MVLHLGSYRVPDTLVAAAHYAGLLTVLGATVWILSGA
jgi:hypothetical protein